MAWRLVETRLDSSSIDVVYTWVNGADPAFQAQRTIHAQQEVGDDVAYRAGPSRFTDNGELRFSLRSLECNMPFVRRVYIVHTGSPPSWINRNSNVVLVPQASILPAHMTPSYLSDTIEAYLYRLPDLAEQYVYFNDDAFLAQPHSPEAFFDANGRARVGISGRLMGDGAGIADLFRHLERRTGRALMRQDTYPAPDTNTKYPWMPLALRCWLKQIYPLNSFTHVAHPFRRSVWDAVHKTFAREIEEQARYRFRTVSGFLVNDAAHHLARAQGLAVFERHDEDHVLLSRASGAHARHALANQLASNNRITRFCLNDEPAPENDGWDAFITNLLSSLWPTPSRWERDE